MANAAEENFDLHIVFGQILPFDGVEGVRLHWQQSKLLHDA
jgi:hypothetical protein